MSKIAINVKNFGAKGDWNGTSGTDDTESIQNVINSASEYSTIFFPNGTYLISSPLTITKNINLNLGNATITTNTEIESLIIISSSVLLRHNRYIGGILDGGGLVNTILSIKDCGHYYIQHMFIKGIKNIGIYLGNDGVTGSNYEGFFESVYLSSNDDKVTDNTFGLYVNTADCHFNNIIGTRGFSSLIYNKGLNFYSKVHGWFDLPTGSRTLIRTSAECIATQCYADCLSRPFIIEGAGYIKLSQSKILMSTHDNLAITPRGYALTFNDCTNLNKSVFADCHFNGRYPGNDYISNLPNAEILDIKFSNCTYDYMINSIIEDVDLATYRFNAKNYTKTTITNQSDASNLISSIGTVEISSPTIIAELIDGNFSNTTNSYIALKNSLTMTISNNVATCNGTTNYSAFDYIIDSDCVSGDLIYFTILIKNPNGALKFWAQSGGTLITSSPSNTISINSDYTRYSFIVKATATSITIRIGYDNAINGEFYIKEATSINLRVNNRLNYYLESLTELSRRLDILIINQLWFEGEKSIEINGDEKFIVKSFPNKFLHDFVVYPSYLSNCTSKVIPNGIRLTGSLSGTPVSRRLVFDKYFSTSGKKLYVNGISTFVNAGNGNTAYGKVCFTTTEGVATKSFLSNPQSTELINTTNITGGTMYLAVNDSSDTFENIAVAIDFSDVYLSEYNDDIVYSKVICKNDGEIKIPIYTNGYVVISPYVEDQTSFAIVNIVANCL